MFDCENQKGLFPGELEHFRKTRPHVYEHMQNLTCFKAQYRGNYLKWTWVRSTCCSWKSFWRDRMQLGLVLGIEILVAATLRNLFYYHKTGDGSYYFGILHLAY